MLDLFKERGTLDEMGLGGLRDGIANVLFPGTSTLHTRLRYVLFVPWIYQSIEKSDARAGIGSRVREQEIRLIRQLRACEDHDGIIGARSGASLARLPSNVYWSALQRWGIFLHARSQPWYHTHFISLQAKRSSAKVADDPGTTRIVRPNWSPRIPVPPKNFPETASFALTREEAEFLQGRIEETCAGSLLAWHAREYPPETSRLWETRARFDAPHDLKAVIELADRFSRHVEGMPLLYNLMLAEHKQAIAGSDGDYVDALQKKVQEWANLEKNKPPFNPNQLWEFANEHVIRTWPKQREFIHSWSRRLAAINHSEVSDDNELRRLVKAREMSLKGHRSRFRNKSRILDWQPGAGVDRMGSAGSMSNASFATCTMGLKPNARYRAPRHCKRPAALASRL